MCEVCIRAGPPWRPGSCRSCAASLRSSLGPGGMDCAPGGASPHPGTCTSVRDTHTRGASGGGGEHHSTWYLYFFKEHTHTHTHTRL